MLSSLLHRRGRQPDPSTPLKPFPPNSTRVHAHVWLRTVCALVGFGAATINARAQISVSELKNMGLEDLMEVEVTAVSRRPEPIYATAGAVSVMTGSELWQTGSRTLADGLRYVPGVQVARFDNRTWSISVRGFNSQNPNKLLVLMDGRSVYTPLFSGVLWDVQDTFLPDVDRIEIVRGPGATMWGSNAVNGVISISTKDARYTQGGLIHAGGGTEETGFAGARYGGEVDGKFYYRVYAKTTYRDDLNSPPGIPENQDWRMTQGGFRIDSAMSKDVGSFTIQGDYYDGSIGTPVGQRAPQAGGNLIVRGTRHISPDTQVTAQFYFDHVSRELYQQYAEIRNTYDFDAQVNYRPTENHDLVAGVNYRSSSDHTRPNGPVLFFPTDRRIEIASAFIQDEIRWKDGKYGLVVGSKFEHHESVGLEIQPSIRGAIRQGRHTYWASISRAVRTPSRYDEDSRFPTLTNPLLSGSRDFDSEVVVAYELGYRGQPVSGLNWDISLFFNDYSKLRSREPLPGGRGRQIFANFLQAETYGGEISIKWDPIPRWRLQASYSYLHHDFSLSPGSQDRTIPGSTEANDPEHQASFRSLLLFPGDVEWSVGFRYVSALFYPEQDAYWNADTKISWRVGGQWEVALVGQNLLHDAHTEFGNRSSRGVERGYYGSVTWQF